MQRFAGLHFVEELLVVFQLILATSADLCGLSKALLYLQAVGSLLIAGGFG